MTRAHVLGPVVVTIANQGGGAPIIDGCGGRMEGDHAGSWGGWLVLPLRLWRTPRFERPATRGLAIGWRGASCPMPPHVLLRRALWSRLRPAPPSPSGPSDGTSDSTAPLHGEGQRHA
jgi:hypothetical protein